MNILVIQPGFPAEIPYFVRGLKRQGATVLGIGDGPKQGLPDVAKEGLDAYLQVPNIWDTASTIQALKNWHIPVKLDKIECLWEPGMILAAQLRKAFGLSGMDEEQTTLFRDKELMKQALDKHGIRTPRHYSATSRDGVIQAVKKIGYPVIIKPISGAGSANTYKVKDEAHLQQILPSLAGVAEMSIEEYIEGKEFTFDTICANGKLLYYNIAWYRPNVLQARSEEWISPQTVTLRDTDAKEVQLGLALGKKVLKALNFKTGFTHMEWFLKPNGEAVFGEIGCRPPGGRSVELMNYACDIDVFEGWAEAVIHGSLSQNVQRKYNAAIVFKRAQGQGRICRIEGMDRVYERCGNHIVCNNISPIGAPRRNWKQTLVSDGYIILRHPDLSETMAMTDFIGKELQLFAR